jgi:hypothetical protein
MNISEIAKKYVTPYMATTTEVAHAAVLTWLLFMAVQALAFHFIAEGF